MVAFSGKLWFPPLHPLLRNRQNWCALNRYNNTPLQQPRSVAEAQLRAGLLARLRVQKSEIHRKFKLQHRLSFACLLTPFSLLNFVKFSLFPMMFSSLFVPRLGKLKEGKLWGQTTRVVR